MRFARAILASVLIALASSEALAELPKSITAKDGAVMVLIPEGSFTMGTEQADLPDTAPLHSVFISAFYMDEHLVTNRQFAAFLNTVKPSEGKDSTRWSWVVIRTDIETKERAEWWPTEIEHYKGEYKAFEGFEDYPVFSVSWEAAEKYCRWAGKRLPTEAEWEKSARGGLKQKLFVWGDALPTDGVAYNRSWEDNADPPPTGPVKSYLPNGYGLYNISGMLWEWCHDWYAPDYYKNSPGKDPVGPESGQFKILRGGSWHNAPNGLRVGLRNYMPPELLDETTGFRCAADPPQGKDN